MATSSASPKQQQRFDSSPQRWLSWYSFSCFTAFVIILAAATIAGFAFLPRRHSFAQGAGGRFDTSSSTSTNNHSSSSSSSSSQLNTMKSSDNNSNEQPTSSSQQQQYSAVVRIAHLGNSIQYYNDCPRLLEQMIASTGRHVVQDSCLRGGATLEGLFRHGNGMHAKFGISPNAGNRSDGTVDIGAATVTDLFQGRGASHHNKKKNAPPPIWDFCVMNDFTQGPARSDSRDITIRALKKLYFPLFLKQKQDHSVTLIPILLQTPAYRRSGVKDTHDLGDFDNFTKLLEDGYRQYAQVLAEMRFPARVAPLGNAFKYIHDNYDKQFWERLYCDDEYHPSPHGSWLEACVLYGTIFQEVPPRYQEAFWSRQRYRLPPEHRPLPLPTAEEAETLRQVAVRVCGLEDSQHRNSFL
jgi:hypothetical protein